ncbi:MAG: hypothetical protein GX963_06915, partial [Bacteroidales bacterium]|nr:hypothetical protein [Bacteroidales bacterium]
AQALADIAKVIFRKDGSGQLAGGLIKFLENGGLQVGDFDIDGSGTLLIKDGNQNRVRMTKGDITTLDNIKALAQDDTYDSGTSSYTGIGVSKVIHPNYKKGISNSSYIDVKNNNTKLRVSFSVYGNIYRPSSSGPLGGYAHIKVNIINYFAQETEGYLIYQQSFAAQSGTGTTDWSYETPTPIEINIGAGRWVLRVTYTHFVYENQANWDFYSKVDSLSVRAVHDGTLRITEIGKNGVGVLTDANNYSFFGVENGNYKAVEKVSNSAYYDKPGLLLSGIKWGSGSVSFYFGSYGRANSGKIGSDEYQVNHTIGHTDYTVILTPITTYRQWWVTEKASTYFRIKMNSTTESQCEFAVFGNNK